MNKFGKIYASLSSVVVVVLFCLLVFLRNLPSEALVAFIGVLVGSLISSFVQYAMSEANMRQQLRLAALDKRLQAAQEAMTLWQRLRVANEKETDELDVLKDCKHWWDTNSLYLTAEARTAFLKAYRATGELLVARARHADWEEMKALSAVIDRAAPIIAESVYLPPIGELESGHNKTHPNKKDA
ncbi:MAG: hypothetical protein MUO30_03360 [Anaerolineales bacterium]|nr:hypothetical protein [Anaerolineales bacterium]